MSKIACKLVMGSLMYEMVCTQLDITFVVGNVFQHLATLGNAHWSAIKTLLQFMFFLLGFLVTNYPKVTSIKKNYHVNLDKLFWPCPT